jgi:hypothetical protein
VAAAAVVAAVAAACRPTPGDGLQQRASLLVFCALTRAAKVPGVHVHVKHIWLKANCGGPCLRAASPMS